MVHDDGITIPGLNEDWTFLGANLNEWAAGLVTFMLASNAFDKITRAMPILLAVWILTTFSMAGLRKKYPDEQKGMMNHFATVVGVAPPGIPAPACIQPIWSGAPLRTLDANTEFSYLELEKIFPSAEDDADILTE